MLDFLCLIYDPIAIVYLIGLLRRTLENFANSVAVSTTVPGSPLTSSYRRHVSAFGSEEIKLI